MTPERRENLVRMLSPRHIAVVGGKDAAIAAEQCAAAGFDGPIWAVNPRRKELGGLACFPRVEDLPDAPDAVFLAVPRAAAIEVTGDLAAIGAGGVICYTAGFGEIGEEGAALECELIRAAGDLAFVGPNCYGLLNYVRGAAIWPYGHGGNRVERGVAIVTQSGMLGTNLTMNQRSVPIAYVISAGNLAVLGIEDYLDVLVDDPAVTAIGLYIETVDDVPRFADAVIRALEADIPVVALKVGRSEVGQRLTVTHTGSLAGQDALYQALFDRLAIVRVGSPVELLETLKMLTVAGAPKGKRIAGFTCSGGDATMLADGAEDAGLEFPQPSPAVAKELAQRLPEIATVSNPLDYTTPIWGDVKRVPGVFAAMLRDGFDGALLVQDYPLPNLDADRDSYLKDAAAFGEVTRAAGIPAAICSDLDENIDQETREILVATKVAPLQGIDVAMKAMGGAALYGRRRAAVTSAGSADALRLTPMAALKGEISECDEWAAKQRLAATGLSIPEGRRVAPEDAPAAAQEIGFPVAVKLVAPGMMHKTEAGAVRLNLQDADQVAVAARGVCDATATLSFESTKPSILVERMVEDAVAELLVGIRREEGFGMALTVGSGGILAELVGDTRTVLLPADRAGVEAALSELRVSALLDGYRGRRGVDTTIVVDAITTIAQFAFAHLDTLIELEINPLMILGDRCMVVDAVMHFGATETAARPDPGRLGSAG